MSSSASSGGVNCLVAVTNSSKFSMRTSPFSPFSCLYISYRPDFLITKSVCSASAISVVSSSIALINSTKRSNAEAERPESCSSCKATCTACHKVIERLRVICRIVSKVRSPIPRGGVLTTRSNAASSWRLAIKRK